MIIVRIWYTLTSMPRKFDINQYPKTFILYSPLQTFNFAFNFLDSAFVSSDGKWKIEIFYTEINDIIEYSKNCAPWWNYFCNIQIKKTETNTHTLWNLIRKAMMSVDYSFSQHLSNKNLKHVTVQCIWLATNKKKCSLFFFHTNLISWKMYQ